MSWLLNILYAVGLLLYAPRLLYRYLLLRKNRRGWSQKLFGNVPERKGSAPCIWMHAVSVGEVNLLGGMISQIQREHPQAEVVISTSTETGFDLASSKYGEHLVFFCPMDFSWAIQRAIKRVRPSTIVLTELELWPNLISIASQNGVSMMVANARLSESSFRGYRRLGFLVNRVWRKLDWVGAQTPVYARRFESLGVASDRISVTGNIKFDNAETDRNNKRTRQLSGLLHWNAESPVLIAGSTQPEEEAMVVDAYLGLLKAHPNLKLIVVPRHIERAQAITLLLDERNASYRLRSKINLENVQLSERHSVLVVDVIGELGAWWGCADIAYVGGSMGSRGGQNMIEPAAYGTPVCFGPKTKNFKAVVEQLLASQGAEVVHNETELKGFVTKVLSDNQWASRMGKQAQELVLEQQGAVHLTCRHIAQSLKNQSEVSASRAA